MKYLLFITIVYSCSKSSSSSSNSPFVLPAIYHLISDDGFVENNGVLWFDGKKYNGYLLEFSDNKQDTLLKVGYKNGLQEGHTQKRYITGAIMEYRVYHKGKKHGIQVAYWPNGNKRFEFIAQEDRYEGEMKEWNIEGNLVRWANYKNGQEEGAQKMWRSDGKIRSNYVIKNGRRFGLLGTKNCVNVSDSIVTSK